MKRSFLPDEQMRSVRLLKQVVCISAIIVCLLPGPMQAAGDSNAVDYDVIRQAGQVLTQAAKVSPQWHTRQAFIQRDVQDITFLLEQSWRAAEKSKHTERKDYAQQALTLLQRGAKLGHFDLAKTEPVLTLIQQLLSDQAG